MPETTPHAGTDDDHREIEAWFARYDTHAANGDVEAMASMALFPLNLVTDDAAPGSGVARQWSREEFLRTMSAVMGDGGGEEVRFESRRSPRFLSRSLAVVFTRSTMTAGAQSRSMTYADILVRQDGEWYFQTMIQAGWAATLTGGEV